MQTKAIKVEIDLTETIPDRYLGSSEDGPLYGPVAIIDAIVDAAATKLVADGDKALRKLVATAMEERVAALLDAELPGIFEKALNDPVEISDEWGGRKKSKTLSQIIGERARAQMNASTDRYGNGRRRDTARSGHPVSIFTNREPPHSRPLLDRTYSGPAYRVGPEGWVRWNEPAVIGGAFRITDCLLGGAVVMLTNGEGEFAQVWAVAGSDTQQIGVVT